MATGAKRMGLREKIAASVLAGAILLVLGFVWSSVTTSSEKIAGVQATSSEKLERFRTELAGSLAKVREDLAVSRHENDLLRKDVAHLRELIESRMDDRYRASQARADFALRDKDIAKNAAGLTELRAALGEVRRALERHEHIVGHNVVTERVAALEARVRELEGKKKGGD